MRPDTLPRQGKVPGQGESMLFLYALSWRGGHHRKIRLSGKLLREGLYGKKGGDIGHPSLLELTMRSACWHEDTFYGVSVLDACDLL